jgi:nicotinamidase-related amidase
LLVCTSTLLLTACGGGAAPASSSATGSLGSSAASQSASASSAGAVSAQGTAPANPSQSGASAKPTASGAVANANTVPAAPAPVAVSLDPATTAYLVMDISSSNCIQQSRPTCVASLTAINSLLKKARDAKVPVIYTLFAGSTVLPEVAPQTGEQVVQPTNADKFDGTNLDDLLKQRKVTTLLLVGTAANGAVLYTGYAANARGYTVAVAEDGISTTAPFDNALAEYLLLHEPGPANADNKPLADKSVTLTRSDLVSFNASGGGASSIAAKPAASASSSAANASTGSSQASPAPSGVSVPPIPAAASVSPDAKTSALLVLDINTSICQPRAACMTTVPAITSLIKKARDAQVAVVYSDIPNANSNPLPDIAPQAGESVVRSSANKFFNTNLADILKQKQVTTLVMVGTVANGAVMYSAFPATVREYTVVVAEDGLSSAVPLDTTLAEYQLLRFPANPENKPLAPKAVTLSRSDLITFK